MANAMSTARSFVLADGLEGLDDGFQGVMAISRGGLGRSLEEGYGLLTIVC